MVIKNFKRLSQQLMSVDKKRVGIVNGVDPHSLESVFDSSIREKIHPVIIGETTEILPLLTKYRISENQLTIVHTESPIEAAEKAVELVHQGEIDILMKGKITTSDFLRPIVNRETGIVEDSTLTHVVVNEIPTYGKLLVTTDGGMIPEPTYQQKIAIIQNAVDLLRNIGYSSPKVAILAAAEIVNPKIQSSVDAERLMNHFQKKSQDYCQIDGPISLDLALSPEIVILKEYESLVAGDADILIGPDLTTTNILGKAIVVLAQGKIAGIICGAKVPIVLTSRGSSVEEKSHSIILAMLNEGSHSDE